MASLVSSVASYLPFRKAAPDTVPESEEKKEEAPITDDNENENVKSSATAPDPATLKEEDASELPSNKKTDEVFDPSQQPGLLWRMSSGVYYGASGAVGMGVGSVKWVAGKSYDAGSAVVGTTKAVVSKVPVPTLRKKDKKE